MALTGPLWIDDANDVVTTTEPKVGRVLVAKGGEVTEVVQAIVAAINGDTAPKAAAKKAAPKTEAEPPADDTDPGSDEKEG